MATGATRHSRVRWIGAAVFEFKRLILTQAKFLLDKHGLGILAAPKKQPVLTKERRYNGFLFPDQWVDSRGTKDPVILLHTSGYSSASRVHLGPHGSLSFPKKKKPVYNLSASPLSEFTSLNKKSQLKKNN